MTKEKTEKKAGYELPRPKRIYELKDGAITLIKRSKPLMTTHKGSAKKVESMKGESGDYDAFSIKAGNKTIATVLIKQGCVFPGSVSFKGDPDCWYVGGVKY